MKGVQVTVVAPVMDLQVLPADVDAAGSTGADLLLKEAKECAVMSFKDKGELPAPFALLLARKNPQTRLSFARPHLLFLQLPRWQNDDEKDIGRMQLEVFAEVTAATGVAFVSESWLLRAASLEERNKFPGPVRDHPDRTECIVITLEHRSKLGMSAAHIMRDQAGRPTLSAWEDQYEDVEVGDGRFSHLLPAQEGGS